MKYFKTKLNIKVGPADQESCIILTSTYVTRLYNHISNIKQNMQQHLTSLILAHNKD